jgi:hypothetical protein
MVKDGNWSHSWDGNWSHSWDGNWSHSWDGNWSHSWDGNWSHNWDGNRWGFNKSIRINNPSVTVTMSHTVQVLNELLVHLHFFSIVGQTCVLK